LGSLFVAATFLSQVHHGAQAEEEYGGRRAKPSKAGDLCEVADSNLQKAADAILKSAAKTSTPAVPIARWDHRKTPQYLDHFERRYSLRPV
jgi:hypothetical protein